MSTHLTSREGGVAFYDSVTGTAFGPVCESETEADEFEAWVMSTRDCDGLQFFSPHTLQRLWDEFQEQRSSSA